MFRLLKNDNITVIKKAIFLLTVILIFTLFLTTNVRAGPATPVFTDGPVDNPDPVTVGNDVNFSAIATDANAEDLLYLAICKSDAITTGAPPACPGGDYCISSAVASGLENSCIWTSEGSGEQPWYGFVCDNSAQLRCSGSVAGSITVILQIIQIILILI